MNIANNYWPYPEGELHTLPQGETFVCMFSGGKDSGLALSLALDTGHCVGVLHCLDADNETIWHYQKKNVIEAQTHAMGIPLILSSGSPWKHRSRLVRLYRQLVKDGVESIVFGELFEEQEAKLQIALCISSGLKPRMPLWRKPYSFLISEIEKRRLKSVISWIDSAKLDSSWLGHTFDHVAFTHFQQAGIDPMGEYGEFHTTLVDADFYHHAVKYQIGRLNDERIIIDVS